MNRRFIGDSAARHAEMLIDELGIRELPIDPFEIAKRHDIMVMEKPPTVAGVSGFLMKLGDKFVIGHATHVRNKGFIRFTVSHELGHYFLPGHPEALFPNGSGTHASKSGFVSSDRYEVEADHFASSLLMPEKLFREAIPGAGEGFDAISTLSTLCGSSITATAIRYAMFAEDPVAVIVSSGPKIDYCFMSDALRNLRKIEWISRGSLLPTRSETYEFNKDFDNIDLAVEAEGNCSLDEWFDGALRMEMREDVVGLGSYGKTLTVLSTSDAIEDEDDNDFEEDDDV